MKVAILGAGRMGETVLGHCKESDLLEEAIGYDIRPERVEELRQKGFHASSDLEAILKDPAVQLVFVTASNDSHKELALQAMETGKAVMCEKPIASTLEDARAMVRKAEADKLFFQIGFELRYSKLYATVKEWIDAGLLGEVVNTQCTYIAHSWEKNQWRVKKNHCGNLFAEKLSHYVDLPRWWVGSAVEEVFCASAPNIVPYMEVRDNYHATYRFANGAVSHITFMMGPSGCFYRDPQRTVVNQQVGLDGQTLRYLVVGTKGAAETDVVSHTLKRWEFSDTETCMESIGVECLTWDSKDDHHYIHNTHHQTLDIIRRVHDGQEPKTPARDAFETMRLSFAADKSANEGRPVRMDELLPLTTASATRQSL